jgi:hypothetical protein
MQFSDYRRVRRFCRNICGVAVLSFAVAFGCRFVPIEERAPRLTPPPGSSVTAERLNSGRTIYLSENKCASCHNPKSVREYTAEEWEKNILPRMGKKAKLTPDEYDSVLAYVAIGSQTQAASKP